MTISPTPLNGSAIGPDPAERPASQGPAVWDGSPARFDAGDTPTQRIRSISQTFGPDVLHDAEILELVLAGAGLLDVTKVAETLYVRFGGLAGVAAADQTELSRYVSKTGVFALKLLHEASQRLARADLAKRCLLTSSAAVCAYLRATMAGRPREEFWVLFLDRRNQLLVAERMARGTVDHVPVYPREVLRRALEVGASALILAHNHPSGDPTPSGPDIETTKQILQGARALSISVWDHMIVGRDSVVSLKAQGLM